LLPLASGLAPGVYTITAEYNGDNDFTTSDYTLTLTGVTGNVASCGNFLGGGWLRLPKCQSACQVAPLLCELILRVRVRIGVRVDVRRTRAGV
jgi:hypothetical protein